MAQPLVVGYDEDGASLAAKPEALHLAQSVTFQVDWTDIDEASNVNFGPEFPDNAIITNVVAEVDTAFTSAASTATIGLGFTTDAATGIQASAAVSGAPWSTTGYKAFTPIDTPATFLTKLTAARQMLFTRGVQALTGGHMTLKVEYFVGA